MLQEDQARYKVWQQLANPFDYKEFSARCVEAGWLPMDATDFAYKVGRIMVGKVLYPELSEPEAYQQILVDYPLQNIPPKIASMQPVVTAAPINLNPVTDSTKSCCGGGKVL
jgi:hypothetical protein